GGIDNFTSGFLPATYQGSVFNRGTRPLANVTPAGDLKTQRQKLDLIHKLDSMGLQQTGPNDAIESAIANYETAFRMQTAVPEVSDLSKESAATKKLYGFEHAFPATRIFAAECLLARRLIERGVRFIELTCPVVSGDRWDQHGNLKE